MKQYLNTVLKEIKVLQNVDEIVKKGKEILETSVDFSACLRLVVCSWSIIITLISMRKL